MAISNSYVSLPEGTLKSSISRWDGSIINRLFISELSYQSDPWHHCLDHSHHQSQQQPEGIQEHHHRPEDHVKQAKPHTHSQVLAGISQLAFFSIHHRVHWAQDEGSWNQRLLHAKLMHSGMWFGVKAGQARQPGFAPGFWILPKVIYTLLAFSFQFQVNLLQAELEVEIGDLDQTLRDQKSGQEPFQRHLQLGKQQCHECKPPGRELAHTRSCLHAMHHSHRQSTPYTFVSQPKLESSLQPAIKAGWARLAPTSVCTRIWFDKTPTDLGHSWHHESWIRILFPTYQCSLQQQRSDKWLTTTWEWRRHLLEDANIDSTQRI